MGSADTDRASESGAATPIAFVAQAEHPAVDIASPPNAAEHPAVDIAWHHKEPAGISAAGFDVRNLAPETGDRDGAQTMASDIIDTLDRRSLSVGISKGLGSREREQSREGQEEIKQSVGKCAICWHAFGHVWN